MLQRIGNIYHGIYRMETFTVHEHTLWRVRTLEACFLRRQNLDVSSVDTAEHKRVLLVVLIELGCL